MNCDLIENSANWQTFTYCRTHKCEAKDCPKNDKPPTDIQVTAKYWGKPLFELEERKSFPISADPNQSVYFNIKANHSYVYSPLFKEWREYSGHGIYWVTHFYAHLGGTFSGMASLPQYWLIKPLTASNSSTGNIIDTGTNP